MGYKRVALITGGTRGIGFGIAKSLAKEGFDLAVNGVRDKSLAEEHLKELQGLGAEVIYCQGDIAVAKARDSVIGKIKKHYSHLNVLVNNAGVAPPERKDILEATEEDFEYVIRTNLQGSHFMTQTVANWMIEQKKTDPDLMTCIVNITSISAAVASVSRGEYCISKAGLSMSTQLFAVRLGEYNIPVYEIRPGVIATDMTSGVKDKYDRMIDDGLCVQRRWGVPEDIGRAVAALVRGDFPYSTGQVIMVDGGMTIPRL
ncbi:MAG: 3-ketoacyl-ACP reductase [Chlorobi bacterium]|nr:3-ketoacyl-ACP reductase [Chlorobiota bacterium]